MSAVGDWLHGRGLRLRAPGISTDVIGEQGADERGGEAGRGYSLVDGRLHPNERTHLSPQLVDFTVLRRKPGFRSYSAEPPSTWTRSSRAPSLPISLKRRGRVARGCSLPACPG
jgi:hypothetical protein